MLNNFLTMVPPDAALAVLPSAEEPDGQARAVSERRSAIAALPAQPPSAAARQAGVPSAMAVDTTFESLHAAIVEVGDEARGGLTA